MANQNQEEKENKTAPAPEKPKAAAPKTMPINGTSVRVVTNGHTLLESNGIKETTGTVTQATGSGYMLNVVVLCDDHDKPYKLIHAMRHESEAVDGQSYWKQ